MNDDMETTTYDDEIEQEEVKDQLRDMLRDEDEQRADDARQLEEQEQDEQQVEDEEEAYSDFVDAERMRDEGYTEEDIERIREEEEANYWGVIQDNKTMIYEVNEGKDLTPEDQKVLEQWQQEEGKFKQYQLQREQEEEQESWFDSEDIDEDEIEEVEA